MYNNISLYFSSDCNMSCQYCAINKHKPCMAENNKHIREDIESGAYAQAVIDRFSPIADGIVQISLWGMEPTLNTDLFEKLMFPLWDAFPNINKLMFSTNSWLGWSHVEPVILGLDKYCKNRERNINFDLQLSLDGPEWINDHSRRNHTTERTLQMMRDVITNTPSDIHYAIDLHTKPTLDVSYMRQMNESNDLLLAYYHFFDDLQDEMLALNTNPHIHVSMNNTPTLVNPGEHTVEDGKTLAEFLRNLRAIDVSQFKHFKHPLICQPLNGIIAATQVTDHNSMSHWGCCSSGRYSANVDNHGDLFSCHALFGRSYLGTDSTIAAAHTTLKDNDAQRLQYVDLLWQEYPEARREFCEIIMLALASAGQIDKVYLTDAGMRKLLFYSMGNVYCQYGHLESTHSIWAYTTSQFKYFGNGALQEIMRYVTEQNLI